MNIPSESATILIVDDSPANCDFLARRLRRRGYRCEEAHSGAQALTLIARELPDVVLLDVMMPEMDGMEVLRVLRRQHDSVALPVLIVTARSQADDLVNAFAAGANNYIEKPIDFAVLLARLQHHLAHKRLDDEVKRSQAALAAQNRELEASHRYKDNFLSFISHEMRTPLNSVLGYAEVLLDEMPGPLNDKQRQYCRVIQDSGAHLLRIINDLLDLSRLEAGRLPLDPQPATLAGLIDAAIELMQDKARRRGVQLSVEIAPDIGEVVWDPLRAKQILINLLSNALKFTEAGRSVQLSAAAAAGDRILLQVSDEGCGIRDEDLQRIFQPFEQACSPLGRRAGEGSGLGLALVNQLVKLHGGQIEVQSTPGVGSCFSVRLPRHCRVALPAEA